MDAYSLGQILREARESKELEIEDVVASLRIRQPILESFEAGDFEISGVPEIQIRGLMRIYARHLELDEENILLLYAQMRLALEKGRRGRRGRRRRPAQAPVRIPGSTQPLQEFETADRRASGCRSLLRALFLLLFSAAAIAIIIFVTVQLVGIEAFLPASATPEIASLAPTATAPEPASEIPPVSSPPPQADRAQYDGAGILVSLLATQRSWLSLSSDGSVVYEGIAEADTLLEYRAENEILLSAANALALDVIWNGQRQGIIGERGQRVDIRFTADQAIITLGPGGAPSEIPATEAVDLPATEQPAGTVEPPATEAPSAASPTPTITSIPTDQPTALPSPTPLPTATSAPTALPSPTEPPAPTAILPPRVTQAGLPPTKPGI